MAGNACAWSFRSVPSECASHVPLGRRCSSLCRSIKIFSFGQPHMMAFHMSWIMFFLVFWGTFAVSGAGLSCTGCIYAVPARHLWCTALDPLMHAPLLLPSTNQSDTYLSLPALAALLCCSCSMRALCVARPPRLKPLMMPSYACPLPSTCSLPRWSAQSARTST